MSATVRVATGADLDAIEDISAQCFDNPWTRASIASDLERSWTRVLVVEGHRGGKGVVGFVHFWLVADEVQVMNVAVAPRGRRMGYARALVAAMISYARALRSESVHLEVRAGNAAAIGLYAGFGFVPTGRRERYYDDGEDAVLMSARLER